jgi:hypothetical protein
MNYTLNTEVLIQKARDMEDLADFGGASFKPGLDALTHSLNTE